MDVTHEFQPPSHQAYKYSQLADVCLNSHTSANANSCTSVSKLTDTCTHRCINIYSIATNQKAYHCIIHLFNVNVHAEQSDSIYIYYIFSSL